MLPLQLEAISLHVTRLLAIKTNNRRLACFILLSLPQIAIHCLVTDLPTISTFSLELASQKSLF
jgi:hypothetical protein